MWKRGGSGKPQQNAAAVCGLSLAERTERQAAVDRSICSRLLSSGSQVRVLPGASLKSPLRKRNVCRRSSGRTFPRQSCGSVLEAHARISQLGARLLVQSDRLRGTFRPLAIRPEQIAEAGAAQRRAASDGNSHVRLIAGPGTGKSFTVEDRICWLLTQGEEPRSIAAVSFTRASAFDLQTRVRRACVRAGHPDAQIGVTTLHSLALRSLRAAESSPHTQLTFCSGLTPRAATGRPTQAPRADASRRRCHQQ
jgi:hypothetical protein